MEHWREAVDQATSRVYYYNRKTRETSWVPPLGYERYQGSDHVAREPQKRGYFSVSDVDQKRSSESYRSPLSRSSSSTKDDGPLLSVNEEREIKTAVDSSTGRTYYYDRKTRETFWEDPRKENSELLVERLLQRVRTNLSGSPAKYRSEGNIIQKRAEIGYCDERERGVAEEGGCHSSQDNSQAESKSDGKVLASPESSGSGRAPSPSIDDVRASLTLLKTRLKSRSSDVASLDLKTTAPGKIPINPPPARAAKPKQKRRPWFRSSSKKAALPECKRQSGCTCHACVNETHVELDLVECTICKRSFHPESYEKHQKGCSVQPRKIKIQQLPKADVASKPTKSTSWRKQSELLRAAVKRSGNGEGYKETLVPCPHCGRSFNEKAAKRHIPICTQIKAKPKMLRRRSGVGAFKNQKKALEQSNSSPRGQHKSTTRTKEPAKRVSVSESGVSRSRCPHCSRQFSTKAFERHLDFCRTLKEKNTLERKSGAPHQRKEVLEFAQTIPSLENSDFIGIDETGQYYYKLQFDD